MLHRPRTALFGITPLSLLLGRACCLADNPPLGLHDPSEAAALEAALCLGISARRDPRELHPSEAPLQVALVGSAAGMQALAKLEPSDEMLVLALYSPDALTTPACCWVEAEPSEHLALSGLAILATVPELTFRLNGPREKQQAARDFLSGLSATFNFAN